MIPAQCGSLAVYSGPLNAALAAYPLQSQVDRKSTSGSESADALGVPTPRDADLQTIVLILDSQPRSDGVETVGERQRVLLLVGEVDDRRSEDRPIAAEQHPARQPQLFYVAKILDGGIDVPVEPQITDLGIGLGRADRQVDLIPSDGERILVWTIPTSGKAKRIRNNPRVTVAPCTARGKATGAAIPATATFLPDGDAARANDLMNKHYGFQKRLLDGVKWLIRTVRRMPRIENGFLVITPA